MNEMTEIFKELIDRIPGISKAAKFRVFAKAWGMAERAVSDKYWGINSVTPNQMASYLRYRSKVDELRGIRKLRNK